jgi:signal transduction histidine kinase
MIRSLLNWRSFLALVAIVIVSATIFYSQYLAKKIADDERQKVSLWVAASKAMLHNPGMDLTLPNLIRNDQQSIPIIETNEQDSIIDFINLDSARAAKDRAWLYRKVKKFRSENRPLEVKLSDSPYIANRYYYGHTTLLDEVRYYPLVQLFIVALFIFFILYSITIRNKATTNQLWAGMAKETAHQLGTPVSSLEGWVEMLRESNVDPRTVQEIQKDVDRLKLVSDRFGKIGSTPVLEERDLIGQIRIMMEYIRKRATGKVQFVLQTPGGIESPGAAVSPGQAQPAAPPTAWLSARISGPLFDWVIENLLKNALDAMEGKGSITVAIANLEKEILIDVTDTGKGITSRNLQKVFKPGFTTKKRGWGLGLSLSKRIIEQYHKGQLFVRQSELGKGTTFRIVLKK